MGWIIYRRSWQTPARERRQFRSRPDRAFREFFSGSGLGDIESLWAVYQEWHMTRRQDELAIFKNDIISAREAAQQEIDTWPSPFVNGKKGEPYRISFKLPPCVGRYIFKNLESVGLACGPDPDIPGNLLVEGTPRRAGEFPLELIFNRKGTENWTKPAILKRDFKLLINPDPRDLWRDIPTSRNIEYYKEDLASELLECEGMTLVAASRRGRSHAHAGTPRDDDFGLGCANGWRILAVADGAGSAQYSREGSRLACKIALHTCMGQLVENQRLDEIFTAVRDGGEARQARNLAYAILAGAAHAARKAIYIEAKKQEREPKKYATTLLLCMAKHYPAGWFIMSFQIGDGAMAILSHDGENHSATLLAEPDEGEYGGQTRFITMREIFDDNVELMRRVRIDLVRNFDAIILMTDGVSDARFATLANLRHAAMWWDLWRELKSLREHDHGASLLNWLSFWSKGNHDDRTIAILSESLP